MSPYFSIIIPTRERSHILRYVLTCALRQDFDDYEVVLIDNDTSDATEKVAREFLVDPKFRYCRTGNMSMHDNWEFGANQAKGLYFDISGDKHWFRRDALTTLHSLCEKHTPGYCNWAIGAYREPKIHAYTVGDSPNEYWVSTEEQIRRILCGDISQSRGGFREYCGFGYSGLFHRDLVRQIREKSGRLCCKTSPDCTSIFQMLLNQERFLFVPSPITTVVFPNESNGLEFRKKSAKGLEFAKHSQDTLYSLVPVKCASVPNIVNDFLEMALIHRPERNYRINQVEFFVNTWNDILRSVFMGLDVTAEIAMFNKALGELEDRNAQNEIRRRLHVYRHMSPISGHPRLEMIRQMKFKFIDQIQNLTQASKRILLKEKHLTYYKSFQDFFERY